MTDSKNAHDYGSWLNFIPVGPDGYAIELGPVNKDGEVWWRWSIRRDIHVEKCVSEKSFATREDAFADASDWWQKNFKSYWNHSYFMPHSKPSQSLSSGMRVRVPPLTNRC